LATRCARAHREIPVRQADVHLEAAAELLVDEEAVVLLHAGEAPGTGQLQVTGASERRSSDGGDAEAQVVGY
jgi:hypothetical protein